MISAARVDESLVPDDVLVERARIGSPAAFAELVERHRDAVYTIVRNLCRTATDTEETLHEAFLTAWRDLRSFPAGARFTTWLYSVATRTGLAYRMRRYGRQRTSGQLDASPSAFDGKGRIIARDNRWPAVEATRVKRIEITAALRDALESIDDLSRAAFVLCDGEAASSEPHQFQKRRPAVREDSLAATQPDAQPEIVDDGCRVQQHVLGGDDPGNHVQPPGSWR